MMNCLFCKLSGPFSTREHIVPEAMGNDDLILEGQVCDACQRYFGKEVEKYVLEKTPFAGWRAILGIRGKAGRLPCIDMSQPKTAKGKLPDKHPFHDDGVLFQAQPDGTQTVEIRSAHLRRDIRSGSRSSFHFVMTPKVLCMLGRLLGKIGVELLCLDSPSIARAERYDRIRAYARRGTTVDLWPLFHFSEGTLQDLVWLEPTIDTVKEEVLCYSYSLVDVDGVIAKHTQYTLLRSTVGTDNWVICLNDPYPHPVIRENFPGKRLRLIWYSREELANKGMQVNVLGRGAQNVP